MPRLPDALTVPLPAIVRALAPRRPLSRGGFWLASGALWLAWALLDALLPPALPSAATLALAAPMLYALWRLCAARLLDRGRPARVLGALLIPVAGAAWLAWELALAPGVESARDTWLGAGR
jgi:hypothetical protein